jgi:hypothetical protein
MLTNTTFSIRFDTANGALRYGYIRAPYACKVRDLKCTAQADPGDAVVMSVLDSSDNSIGTATFGSTIAAGAAAGAYAPNATYGDTLFAKGDLIKISSSTQADATAGIHCILELDPFCLSA